MKMEIRNLFKKKLYDIELFSNEDHGGDFQLQVGQMIMPQPVDCSQEILSSKNFTEALKVDLLQLYGEIRELSVLWMPPKSQGDAYLTSIPWVKKNYLDEGIGLSVIKEFLSGTLNISSFNYLTTDREHLAYLRKGNLEYLPFDRHWSLTACLKRENGIVENNIYLFNAEDPEKVLDLKVGVLRYLELAYQAKAMYHWQYAYLFRDSIHNEKLRVMLPIIFPHVKLDLASFGG